VLDRVIESTAIGHESGRSHHTVAVGLDNRAIHTLGKSKIIRIDNQAPHAPV
jgi:hypothetical protein